MSEERLSQKRQLSESEWEDRYSRQIRLDGIGVDGQVVVKESFHCRNVFNKQKFLLLVLEDLAHQSFCT